MASVSMTFEVVDISSMSPQTIRMRSIIDEPIRPNVDAQQIHSTKYCGAHVDPQSNAFERGYASHSLVRCPED